MNLLYTIMYMLNTGVIYYSMLHKNYPSVALSCSLLLFIVGEQICTVIKNAHL